MSSKNRNKIISFLQSQDSFPLVKFNFTKGNWEEGVFGLSFSVWFWIYLLFSSSSNLKAAPWSSGKTSLWATPLAKKYCMVLFSQLLEPDMEVVLSLLHPVLGMQERPGRLPPAESHPWFRLSEAKGVKWRCLQVKPLPTCLKTCWAPFVTFISFLLLAHSMQIHADQASPSQLKDVPNANWLLKTLTSEYKRCAALLAGTGKFLLRLLLAKLHRCGNMMPQLKW